MTDRPNPRAGRLRSRLLHFYFLASRPLTLGVRAAVFDSEGRVFLVRHTYVPGWHFPGGGVEPGESALEALARELSEEGGIALQEEPRLYGLFLNAAVSRRDHVAFFVVRRFAQKTPFAPNLEIAEVGFFAPDALPEGTSRATRERLKEIWDEMIPSRHW